MGETIELTAPDGNKLSAYLAMPPDEPADQRKGAVVVVQEIFGVNGHIRSVADGYANDGYVAIAPALFDRVQTGVELGYDQEGVEAGVKIAFSMSMDDVMKDISAAAGEVARHGNVGIVGYCWGGSICYVASARLADQISAASGYYGGQIMPHIEEMPAAPLMLHFGREDTGIPLADVETISQRWPDVQVFVYEGADHGFNCDARSSFHADAAALARDRTLSHFAEFL